jgi:antitoxin component of MazEF toxin-antitoxin module
MEATVVKIGTSLGVKVPSAVIKNFDLKAGTKVEMNFIRDGEFVFRKKPKVREGWDTAFSQYAMNGEDKLI